MKKNVKKSKKTWFKLKIVSYNRVNIIINNKEYKACLSTNLQQKQKYIPQLKHVILLQPSLFSIFVLQFGQGLQFFLIQLTDKVSWIASKINFLL